jgi:hypothetical protein
VYDFVPGNYESLIGGAGGSGRGKLVAVEGEESVLRPRFEDLLG